MEKKLLFGKVMEFPETLVTLYSTGNHRARYTNQKEHPQTGTDWLIWISCKNSTLKEYRSSWLCDDFKQRHLVKPVSQDYSIQRLHSKFLKFYYETNSLVSKYGQDVQKTLAPCFMIGSDWSC